MEQEFHELIDAVAARLRRPTLWRMAALGLIVGGLLGMALALVARVGGWQVLGWIALGCVVVVPLAAIAVALAKKVDPLRAVRAIDQHYQLKSRTITLWSFLQRDHVTQARRLAMDEAWTHVKRADPAQVVPVTIPKSIYAGAALVILAVVLVFVPLPGSTTTAGAEAEKPPLSLAGEAELTDLAPLTKVDADLARQSLSDTRPVVSERMGQETSLLPTGNEEVVSRYFEASASPTN